MYYLFLQTNLSNLTAEEFKTDVLGATMGGDTDFPEATLEALMEAMVNKLIKVFKKDIFFCNIQLI